MPARRRRRPAGHRQGAVPLIVLLHGLGGSKHDWEVDVGQRRDQRRHPGRPGLRRPHVHGPGVRRLLRHARPAGPTRPAAPRAGSSWPTSATRSATPSTWPGCWSTRGWCKPNIAVSGVSYGGGQSLELAMLKNRMRLPNGKLVPFTSPKRHVPCRWPPSTPCGRGTTWPPRSSPTAGCWPPADTPPATDVVPVGVAKAELDQRPLRRDGGELPGAARGRPAGRPHHLVARDPGRRALLGRQTAKALTILQTYKSAIGIPMPAGGPAPTAIQSGWTDTLFPVSEALHYANRVRAVGRAARRCCSCSTTSGHGWAQDKPADVAATNATGLAFLDSVMLTHRRPPTGVVAIPTTCPATAPSGPPMTGTTPGRAGSRHPVTLSGTPPRPSPRRAATRRWPPS